MQFLARLGLGGCLADDMGLGKTATTLAHLARPAGPAPRHLPAVASCTTGRPRRPGSPRLRVAVHHGTERVRGDRTQPSRCCPTPTSSSPPTVCCAATSSTLARCDGTPSCSTRRRRQEPSHQRGQGGPRAAAPARSWRSPARRSRTGSASCGRSSMPSTPACSAAASQFRRALRQADRAQRRRRGRRPRCAALTQPFVLRRTKADRSPACPTCPTRSSRSPGRRSPASRPSMYQQVVDQLLADAEPSDGHAAARPRAGRAHPAEADLQPPRARARRRLAPRRRGRASWPASTSSSTTCSTSASGRSCSPSSARWASCSQRHLARAASSSTPRSCTAACRATAATGWSTEFQAGIGLAAAARLAEGRRHRAQPHRGQPGDPLRPVVEPGRRGPGHRPGVAHRPDASTVFVHKLVCQGTVEERIAAADRRQAGPRRPSSAPASRGSASCRPTSCATSSPSRPEDRADDVLQTRKSRLLGTMLMCSWRA